MVARRAVLAGVAAALLPLPGWPQGLQVTDVAGWEGARWGMLGDELQKALGPRLRTEVNGIGIAQYFVDDYKVGAVAFPVQLQMNGRSGLVRALVGSGFTATARDAEADAVEAALRRQYGTPGVLVDVHRADATSRRVEWKLEWNFPSTIITFYHYLDVTPQAVADSLTVRFEYNRP